MARRRSRFWRSPVRTALAAALTLPAVSLPVPLSGQAASLVGPGGELDWNRYYTADETRRVMEELHAQFPDLTELYSIGESFEGAPLMMMEVTNEATGPAGDKPALYLDGGIHAAELTGSAVALYLLGYLLTGYDSDEEVTRLLDRGAFYIRPKFNPDGSDLVLMFDQTLRSSVHPIDEDSDGLADEDPPQDLNGDGWIASMRVPTPDGAWFADPDDARILRRVTAESPAPTGAARFDVLREGRDDDGDGRLNEDGIGGIDMNRNFPRNWEREHLQPGAGAFPLSEPETYATVRFIEGHGNIVGIVHGHTSGGFVYRLPSASDPTRFPAEDLALIEHLGAEYTRSTGRPVLPSATHPTDHRYGTLISWGYWDEGIVGWVPEYSPGPEAWVTDYDGDSRISPEEELRFDAEELGGRYFLDWEPFEHPDLGPVEIGGWRSKFWGQNPPPEFLEEEARAQVPWILFLAAQAPRLAVSEPVVTALDADTYRVEVTVTNEGFLPTSLTARGAVGATGRDGRTTAMVVPAPTATLELVGAELIDGTARIDLGHLRGTGDFVSSVTATESLATWTVRRTSTESSVRVRAFSEKAGAQRSGWVALR